MSINYLIATDKEKKDEVIGSALNLYFHYYQHSSTDSQLGKKVLINLFDYVKKLKNFLDYFPRPKIKTIKGMQELEFLKDCYKKIKKNRLRLEHSVLNTSLKYYLYCKEKGCFLNYPPLEEIEEHFLEAVFYCRGLIK